MGKIAKGAGTALTAGKFLDAAIPGKSEKALRQVGKDARDRLSKDQYGTSKAEQEQEASKRLGSMARRGGFGGSNPYQLAKGITTLGQRIHQKGMHALAASLGAQEGAVRDPIAAKSRKMGREQKAEDVNLVRQFGDDTRKRTSAMIGELPEKQKKRGLASNLLEGGATLANKSKEDEAIAEAIATTQRVS